MGFRTEEEQVEEKQCDAFSVEKIFGVAALGAVTSLGLYFLYNNLSEDMKRNVKESIASGLRAAVRLGD